MHLLLMFVKLFLPACLGEGERGAVWNASTHSTSAVVLLIQEAFSSSTTYYVKRSILYNNDKSFVVCYSERRRTFQLFPLLADALERAVWEIFFPPISVSEKCL